MIAPNIHRKHLGTLAPRLVAIALAVVFALGTSAPGALAGGKDKKLEKINDKYGKKTKKINDKLNSGKLSPKEADKLRDKYNKIEDEWDAKTRVDQKP